MMTKKNLPIHKKSIKHLYALILVLAAASMMAISSCKKQQQETQSTGGNQSALKKISAAAGALSPRYPKVENGILVFDDESHFTKYIAFLDAAIAPNNYDSATLREKEFDQDEILGTIENYIGFTSIRRISQDNFMRLNEVGWDRLEDIPEVHFIRDAVMRSVLNEALIVKIGGNYIRYINKNMSVQINAGADAKLLRAFYSLPESATLRDALSIDPGHRYSTVSETTGTGITNLFGKDKNHTLGTGDLSIINLKYDINSCSNSRFFTFSNAQLYQDPGPNPSFPPQGGSLLATFTFDFGDGTPNLTIHTQNLSPGYNEHVVPTFSHTYPSSGVFTMKVHAVADVVYGGATTNYADRNYDIEVAVNGCKDRVKYGAEEFFPVPDGSRAVSGKISVFENGSFFTGPQTRVLSETASWIKSGKWRKSKSEIWGNLHTERRDKKCNVLGQVDGDGWASSSKHIQVHRSDAPYRWYEVTSKHGIKYHNIWYIHDKSLKVCP